MTKSLTVVCLACLLFGCATASKTNELHQGMTQGEVKKQLGNPEQTQFIGNKLVWKYTLLRPFVGMQPYYLIFDPNSQTLQSWYMNEAEFQRNQQEWLALGQSMENQKQQNIENQQRQQVIDLQRKQLQQQNDPQKYKITDEKGNQKTIIVEPQPNGLRGF